MAGQYEEAVRAYDKVILLKPDDAKAYANRGVVDLLLGNDQSAIHDLDRAAVLDPNNARYDDYRKIAHKMQSAPDELTPRERALLERPDKNRAPELAGGRDREKPKDLLKSMKKIKKKKKKQVLKQKLIKTGSRKGNEVRGL